MLVAAAVFLTLFEVLIVPIASDCPSGWKEYFNSDKCIKGFGQELEFMDAMEYCTKLGNGGALVSIHNAFQNSHVATVAKDAKQGCSNWIGLCNFDGSSTYSWTDQSALDYQNWAAGYPLSDIEESMVFLDPYGKNKWLSTDDLSDAKCFVCQQESGQSPQSTTAPPLLSTASTATVGKTSAKITTVKITTAAGGQGGGCLPGWIPYNNYCYFHSPVKRAWAAAEMTCLKFLDSTKKHRARLVSVHTQEEMNFLKSQFTKTYYWLGLRRLATDYPWEWSDGTVLDYTNWASGAPTAEPGRDCTLLAGNADQWDDWECSDKRNFVCKYASS